MFFLSFIPVQTANSFLRNQFRLQYQFIGIKIPLLLFYHIFSVETGNFAGNCLCFVGRVWMISANKILSNSNWISNGLLIESRAETPKKHSRKPNSVLVLCLPLRLLFFMEFNLSQSNWNFVELPKPSPKSNDKKLNSSMLFFLFTDDALLDLNGPFHCSEEIQLDYFCLNFCLLLTSCERWKYTYYSIILYIYIYSKSWN